MASRLTAFKNLHKIVRLILMAPVFIMPLRLMMGYIMLNLHFNIVYFYSSILLYTTLYSSIILHSPPDDIALSGSPLPHSDCIPHTAGHAAILLLVQRMFLGRTLSPCCLYTRYRQQGDSGYSRLCLICTVLCR